MIQVKKIEIYLILILTQKRKSSVTYFCIFFGLTISFGLRNAITLLLTFVHVLSAMVRTIFRAIARFENYKTSISEE